jgi:hypothetical protein
MFDEADIEGYIVLSCENSPSRLQVRFTAVLQHPDLNKTYESCVFIDEDYYNSFKREEQLIFQRHARKELIRNILQQVNEVPDV